MFAKKLIVPGALAIIGLSTVGFASFVSADTASATDAAQTSQTHQKGTVVTDQSTIASVTSAVTAKYNGATVKKVIKKTDGTYRAHVKLASGKKAVVSLDANFTVTGKKHVAKKHAKKTTAKASTSAAPTAS